MTVVALGGNREGGGGVKWGLVNTQLTRFHAAYPRSRRVGFWGPSPPSPWARRAIQEKGRGKPGERPNRRGLGRGRERRQKPRAEGARAAAQQRLTPLAAASPRWPLSAPEPPGQRSRAVSTYPAWVVPAAGARMPWVRHGADYAAGSLGAPGLPAACPAPRRPALPRGGRTGAHHTGVGDALRSCLQFPPVHAAVAPLPARFFLSLPLRC